MSSQGTPRGEDGFKWSREDTAKLVAWMEVNPGQLRGKQSVWHKEVKDAEFADSQVISVKRVRDKATNLKVQWKAAKALQERSGWGLREEENTEVVNRCLEKKCPFFWRLDRIWGPRPSSSPAVLVGSSSVPPEVPGFGSGQQPKELLPYNSEASRVRESSQMTPDTLEDLEECFDSISAEPQANSEWLRQTGQAPSTVATQKARSRGSLPIQRESRVETTLKRDARDRLGGIKRIIEEKAHFEEEEMYKRMKHEKEMLQEKLKAKKDLAQLHAENQKEIAKIHAEAQVQQFKAIVEMIGSIMSARNPESGQRQPSDTSLSQRISLSTSTPGDAVIPEGDSQMNVEVNQPMQS